MSIEKAFQKGCYFKGDGFAQMTSARAREEVFYANSPTVLTIYQPNGKEKEKVTFKFLPYLPGCIHCCDSAGSDVISSYFSGCIMSRYNKRGEGFNRVGHVSLTGTKEKSSERKDDDCLALWESIKAAGVSELLEFKPASHWDKSGFFGGSQHVTGEVILGLITAEGKCFGIQCISKRVLRKDTRTVAEYLTQNNPPMYMKKDDEKKEWAKEKIGMGYSEHIFVVKSTYDYSKTKKT